MVAAPGPAPTPRPPGRVLLRVAGALTQLSCGACLLIGTIGMVLVEQNRTGGVVPAAGWLVAAMAGLVFGGLIYRGGLVSMLIAAAIDAGFGIVLVTFEHDSLRRLLAILPASDVAAIGDALHVAGVAVLGAAAVCLVALPQGIRYARWFRDAAATRSAMSTARGFPPPPVPVRSSAYIIPAEDRPAARRRLFLVLGGVAIAVGAGFGVMVSSSGEGAAPAAAQHPAITPVESGARSEPRLDASGVVADASAPGAVEDAREAGSGGAAGTTVNPIRTVGDLILARRAAVAHADRKALAGILAAGAFGFGIDADEIAEGRDAVTAQLARDLGDPPAGGFTLESRSLAIGEDRGHAWIAEQLDIAAVGRVPRSFAITELAAVIDGTWQIVALHWATPVDDATAEDLAAQGRLPVPRAIPDRQDGAGELDQAMRVAFANRAAFAEARSERGDAFNYGSGGERVRGGAAIKRIFGRLRVQLRIHDGARIVAGSTWDRSQRTAPWIGWAALNVDFTAKSPAGNDVTQTFRVLAIAIKEARGWKIVQTQWSNGGPVH